MLPIATGLQERGAFELCAPTAEVANEWVRRLRQAAAEANAADADGTLAEDAPDDGPWLARLQVVASDCF